MIGKGLVGSAAAKYLSLAQENVAIIGPDEPNNPHEAIVFSSHYDSGRVQRQIGRNDTMTQLNLDAHEHYPWLEKESGISFQGKTGCLYVNPRGMDEYLESAPNRIKKHGTKAQFFNSAEILNASFPEFHFPDDSVGMFEDAPSGHINPRRLIQAQLVVFEKNNGTIFREYVREIDYKANSVIITTNNNLEIEAKRVLVATGAFTNLSDLISQQLALIIKSEIVILARISKMEADRLQKLPSLLYEIDIPELEGIYSTCPLQYPDGQYYLKMGCNLPDDIFFNNDLADVQNWFRDGNSEAHNKELSKVLKSIMPNLQVEDFTTSRCILTRTVKHENPYIGRMTPSLFVAIGQGWGGSTSNSIGKVASHLLLHDTFPRGYNEEAFLPIFEDE